MNNARRNLLRLCLNPTVVAALIVVGFGVFVFAPGTVTTIVPLLILAACPLSMLLMGGAMMRGHHESGQAATLTSPVQPESADELVRLWADLEALRAQIGDGRLPAEARESEDSDGPVVPTGRVNRREDQ